MSNLYGTLSGERKNVTKCGHHRLDAHVRGWECGVYVMGTRDENGEDSFKIYATHGSNGGAHDILIAEVSNPNGNLTLETFIPIGTYLPEYP